MAEPTLTEKQELFVAEYIKDFNGKQAAIRAGYSENSATEQAYAMLNNVQISSCIKEYVERRLKAAEIDALWLLRRLVDEAEADINDMYDDAGALLPIKEWPMVWRKGLVVAIETEELRGPDGTTMGMVKRVKTDTRVKRLEMIGKHINVNAFQENVKVTGLDDLAERLQRAVQRINAPTKIAGDGPRV